MIHPPQKKKIQSLQAQGKEQITFDSPAQLFGNFKRAKPAFGMILTAKRQPFSSGKYIGALFMFGMRMKPHLIQQQRKTTIKGDSAIPGTSL